MGKSEFNIIRIETEGEEAHKGRLCISKVTFKNSIWPMITYVDWGTTLYMPHHRVDCALEKICRAERIAPPWYVTL